MKKSKMVFMAASCLALYSASCVYGYWVDRADSRWTMSLSYPVHIQVDIEKEENTPSGTDGTGDDGGGSQDAKDNVRTPEGSLGNDGGDRQGAGAGQDMGNGEGDSEGNGTGDSEGNGTGDSEGGGTGDSEGDGSGNNAAGAADNASPDDEGSAEADR